MSNVYHQLGTGSLTQNWSDASLITTDDNWSGVPSIVGFRGDDLTASTGVNARRFLAIRQPRSWTSTPIETTRTLSRPAACRVRTSPIRRSRCNGSGYRRRPAPDHVSQRHRAPERRRLASTRATSMAPTDNAVQPIAVQYRVGETGAWTNLPPAGGAATDPQIADATTEPSVATLVTPITVTLPSAVNNQAQVQVRFITANAVGNDEWVGIDNIAVTSDPAPQSVRFARIRCWWRRAKAMPARLPSRSRSSASAAPTATWTSPSSLTAAAANSAIPADFAGSPAFPLAINGTILAGQASATVTVNVNGDTDVEVNERLHADHHQRDQCDLRRRSSTPTRMRPTARILTDDFAGTDVGGVAVLAEAASLQGADGRAACHQRRRARAARLLCGDGRQCRGRVVRPDDRPALHPQRDRQQDRDRADFGRRAR